VSSAAFFEVWMLVSPDAADSWFGAGVTEQVARLFVSGERAKFFGLE
jgi:hypothetical protein